jgi:hypothetical protein
MSFKIHFTIIRSSIPRFLMWFLCLRFTSQNAGYAPPFSLTHTWHVPRTCHSWCDHSNNIWWGLQIIEVLILQFSPVHCYFVSLSPGIFLSTLFSDALLSMPCLTNLWSVVRATWATLSPCSFLDVRDQVSHPYKTTCKIIVLCVLIFMFLDS